MRLMTAEVVPLVGTPAAAVAAATNADGAKAAPASAVADSIAAMATAVQRGDFAAAEQAGTAAPVNLALPRTALRGRQPLSSGAQAAVYAAELCPAHLVACVGAAASQGQHPGGDSCLPVAVKRAVIRESADLDRLRCEAVLLAALRHHPHVACLLGARLLPPGGSQGISPIRARGAGLGGGWRMRRQGGGTLQRHASGGLGPSLAVLCRCPPRLLCAGHAGSSSPALRAAACQLPSAHACLAAPSLPCRLLPGSAAGGRQR